MASGSYFPPPVKEVGIDKKDGKKRMLGIPTISDRIAQMVVKVYLEPRFERIFHKDSYGYRPNRNAHMALEKAQKMSWRYAWVIDMDIKGFFDNIDHELLMKAVTKHVSEKWCLIYIQRWLVAEIFKENGEILGRDLGTPQGGVISPLLANIFLHYAFDKWMEREHPENTFERYADDVIIHAQNEKVVKRVLKSIRARMEEVKLTLHPEKTKIVYCKRKGRVGKYNIVSFDFLGYTFQPRRIKTKSGKIRLGFSPAICKSAKKKITAMLRSMKLHLWIHLTLEQVAKELNRKLHGWIYYYGQFRKSALASTMRSLNKRILKWVSRKYKLRNKYKKAIAWFQRVSSENPDLFAHWKHGFLPRG
jgi:RNA-directed DNA polymerase